MGNLISFGNKRSYDDFRKQISTEIQPLFNSLRDFCLSLGRNVIEDVRMHRVVLCKSITFRWFADLEPQQDSVLLKLQVDKKTPQKTILIRPETNLEQIKELLHDAYNTIH